jgi:xanthine/CO dehydrogenase XdhC/CoxF family maturation factor
MASSSEAAKILEAGVAGISEVVQIIASIPAEHRASAFDAAERSYLGTVQDLGCAEDAGQNWVLAVMFGLRAEVEE